MMHGTTNIKYLYQFNRTITCNQGTLVMRRQHARVNDRRTMNVSEALTIKFILKKITHIVELPLLNGCANYDHNSCLTTVVSVK